MTNSLALWLGFLIVAIFSLDFLVLDWGLAELTMRALIELIRKLAFWR